MWIIVYPRVVVCVWATHSCEHTVVNTQCDSVTQLLGSVAFLRPEVKNRKWKRPEASELRVGVFVCQWDSMEAAKCEPVTVDGSWSSAQTKTVKNKLQLYFGSKKKSGGGDCRVEAEDGAPRAAVFFSSEEGEYRDTTESSAG